MSAHIAAETTSDLAPVHPGEILLEEFMRPYGLTAYSLAARLRVPRARVERLSRGEVSISPDMALMLSKAFGTTPDFWLTLQAHHDLSSPVVLEKAHLDEVEVIREYA